VWGSITSDFNEDDAQDFVSIYKDGPTWSWAYSIAGVTVFTSKLGFQTANDALANLNAIPNLPQRFTGDMIITANNPADLVAAARCWSCLSGKSVRMAVRLWLLCQWAKTKV
jgi:hypothetical protein